MQIGLALIVVTALFQFVKSDSLGTAELVSSEVGVKYTIAKAFVTLFGKGAAVEVAAGEWGAAAAALGWSDFMAIMANRACTAYEGDYYHLKEECESIWTIANSLKKKGLIEAMVAQKCASPDAPQTCNALFLAERVPGYCESLSVSLAKLYILAKIELIHTLKILLTAKACGDLAHDSAGAAALGALGTGSVAAACAAGAVTGPVGWALCGIGVVIGGAGVLGDVGASNRAQEDESQLYQLESQCGTYMQGIVKMFNSFYAVFKEKCPQPVENLAVPQGESTFPLLNNQFEEDYAFSSGNFTGTFDGIPILSHMKPHAIGAPLLLTDSVGDAEWISAQLGIEYAIARVFVSTYGKAASIAVVQGEWGAAGAAVGWSDYMAIMANRKCTAYVQEYASLKKECTNIWTKATSLKKKALISAKVAGVCSSPSKPAACNVKFIAQSAAGASGLCSSLDESIEDLLSLKSIEQSHTQKVLKTARACGDLADESAGSAALGAAGAGGIATLCAAGAVAGPVGWALCGVGVVGGVAGAAGGADASNQASGQSTALYKLEEQCGSYTKGIQDMADKLEIHYFKTCILDSPVALLTRTPNASSTTPKPKHNKYEKLLGNFTVDPHVASSRKDAMTWNCLSASACAMLLAGGVLWMWHKRSSHALSVVDVDRTALIRHNQ